MVERLTSAEKALLNAMVGEAIEQFDGSTLMPMTAAEHATVAEATALLTSIRAKLAKLETADG